MPINLHDTLSDPLKAILEFTYPVVRMDKDAIPEQIATCVFVQVDGSNYLVSAGHALRDFVGAIHTRGHEKLAVVTGKVALTGLDKDGKDHIDLAVLKVESDFIAANKINVVTQTRFSTSVIVENPHSRLISGYPISKNKNAFDRKTGVFNGYSHTYFGFAECDVDFSLFKKSTQDHIGMEYTEAIDGSGKVFTTPIHPRGISGGGAWLLPDLRRPEMFFLEGIFIELHPNGKKRYAFSVRLEHVIGFIRQLRRDGVW